MTRKTCLLTGATSGIGEAAAISLAPDYDLFLTARSKAKADAAEGKIRKTAPDASITWLMGDFAKLSEVRRMGEVFCAKSKTLDLLWHNAGLCYHKRAETQDGYEMMLAVNHLAPFLLSQTLWGPLTSGNQETRIVVTASGAYKQVDKLDLDNLNLESGFKIAEAYGRSKLANILFTRELPKRLRAAAPSKPFTVNCFHPGFVGTAILVRRFGLAG